MEIRTQDDAKLLRDPANHNDISFGFNSCRKLMGHLVLIPPDMLDLNFSKGLEGMLNLTDSAEQDGTVLPLQI